MHVLYCIVFGIWIVGLVLPFIKEGIASYCVANFVGTTTPTNTATCRNRNSYPLALPSSPSNADQKGLPFRSSHFVKCPVVWHLQNEELRCPRGSHDDWAVSSRALHLQVGVQPVCYAMRPSGASDEHVRSRSMPHQRTIHERPPLDRRRMPAARG